MEKKKKKKHEKKSNGSTCEKEIFLWINNNLNIGTLLLQFYLQNLK